jgi:threonine/homoserine/homoserine lactone efflux protein
MLEYILIGSGFAFAAAVQPGPLQAFLFTSVTQKGWKKTLPAAFSPLISDGPIALLMLLLLKSLPEILKPILLSAGGIFLLFIAFNTYMDWKKKEDVASNSDFSTPKTILQAALVNILNPHPYIGWSLVLGPAILHAWHKNPIYGFALVLSFYVTMVISLMLIIFIFGTSGRLKEHQRKNLLLTSGIILGFIGVYQLGSGILLLIK